MHHMTRLMHRLHCQPRERQRGGDQLNLRRQVGLLYLRLGYFDEAQQWLEAVRRARPDDKIVQQALDECQRKVSEAESPEGSR